MAVAYVLCLSIRFSSLMRSFKCYVVNGLFYLVSLPVPDRNVLKFSPRNFGALSSSVDLCFIYHVAVSLDTHGFKIIISSWKTRHLVMT